MKVLLVLSLIASTFFLVRGDDVLVSTYRSIDLVKDDMKKEITNLFDTMNYTTKYNNATIIDTWWWKTETFNLTRLEITKVDYDVEMINNIQLVDTSSVLLQGNFFNLTYDFDYYYSCYGDSKGWGRVVLQATQIKFLKYYNFTGESKKKSAIISFALEYNDYKLYPGAKYSVNSEIMRLAGLAITESLRSSILGTISRVLNVEINKFYDTLSEKSEITFKTNVPNRSFLFTNKEELVSNNLKKGVVYYLSSSLAQIEPQKPKLRNLQDQKIWDQFQESDGRLQLFVHEENLNMIINYLSKKDEFAYTVNNDDISKHLSFRMDVASLGTFYPEILSERPADENIEVNVLGHSLKIKSITGKTIEASFSTNNLFISKTDKSILFEMDADFSYTMRFELNGDFSLNVIVTPSGFKLDQVRTDKFPTVDMKKLTHMITEGYIQDLTEKPYYLFNKGIPLNKYFARINDMRYIEGQGILFIGEPLALERLSTLKY